MKKILALLGFCCLLYTTAEAKKSFLSEHLSLSVGAGGVVAQKKTESFHIRSVLGDTVGRPFTIAGLGACFYLYPKCHVIQFKPFSLSVGIPLFLGFSSQTHPIDPADDAPSSSYTVGLSVPLMVDLNFGACALELAQERNFGFFLGAGYAYTRLGAKIGSPTSDYERLTDKGAVPKNISNLGPRVHAGVKLTINQIPLVTSVGYQSASGNDGFSIIDFSLSAQL